MKQKNENGMTLISLVITVIVLILVSFSVSTNLKNNADLQKLVYLRNDIENLEGKVEEFFDEYGELPASIEYTDISNLKDVFSSAELSSDFYVIDLQTMQGLSLHYGKDYDKIKNVDPDRTTETVNEYKDVYIINKTTHNIFYVQGISIKENGKTIIYYTSKGNSKDFNGTNVANPPEMLSGMKKIMYKNPTNTQKGEIIEEGDEGFEENLWYSYENKKWANAQSKDGSLWVWIPRFAYKIEDPTYNADQTTINGGKIKIKFLIGTTDDYYDDDGSRKTAQRQKSLDENVNTKAQEYTVHPAFTDESNVEYANGGWDKELTGIWVAKFEAGYTEESDTQPTFQGLKYSMNGINQEEAFNISKGITEVGNNYGFSNVTTDSHLMKNSEWGAVAYLSQSQYGLNGNDISNNFVSLKSIENASNIQKGKFSVTGVTSGLPNGDKLIITTMNNINNTRMNLPNDEGVYTWNQQNGQSASSTGTIYGIYDLSGGVNEIISACMSTSQSTKYIKGYKLGEVNSQDENQLKKANYKANMKIYGDAIFETSKDGIGNTSWYQDSSNFFGKTTPYMVRGGSISQNSYENGLFSFTQTNGEASYNIGFRPVLVKK